MSRKNRKSEHHPLDSSRWSAYSAALRVVKLREQVLDRIPHNPIIRRIFESEFFNLYEQYLGHYMAEGFGELQASILAAEELGYKDIPAMDPSAFVRMAMDRQSYIKHTLEQAKLYVITPPMFNTLCAATSALNREHLRYWSADDLISSAGLVLFPRIQHYLLTEDSPVPEELIALSWLHEDDPIEVPTKDGGVQHCTTLRCSAWIDVNGPIESEEFTFLVNMAADEGHPYPDIVTVANSQMLLDLGDSADMASHRPAEKWGVQLPKASVLPTGEYRDEEVLSGKPISDWCLQFLMSFMRMTKQKTVRNETYSQGLPWGGAHKPQPHHDVRVVSLASYETERGTMDGDPSTEKSWSYSVRFPVQVHPVKQWYPKEGKHKLIFRGPFIKGPKDAPLMDRSKKVYKL